MLSLISRFMNTISYLVLHFSLQVLYDFVCVRLYVYLIVDDIVDKINDFLRDSQTSIYEKNVSNSFDLLNMTHPQHFAFLFILVVAAPIFLMHRYVVRSV